MTDLVWKRSTRCDTGSCVLVAFDGDEVLVRDSKHPKAPPLTYDQHSWQLMLEAIKFGGRGSVVADRLTDVLYLDGMREYCWRCEEFCLHFDEQEWDAFVAGAVEGEFDGIP